MKRDGYCAGPAAGMEGRCFGSSELDHVRASGALGMKSPSTVDNLVRLCAAHHRVRTENGRKYRPLLLEYLDAKRRLSSPTTPRTEDGDPSPKGRGASS